jgi:Ca2+-binding EF-hand superfamily protein
LLSNLQAIHKIAGIMSNKENDQEIQHQADEIFKVMDKNHDDRISLQEFIESASKDRSLVSVLELDHGTE